MVTAQHHKGMLREALSTVPLDHLRDSSLPLVAQSEK